MDKDTPSKLGVIRAQRRSGGKRPDYRALLLEVIDTLLSTTSFADLLVDDIASAAGLSRATFYSHFASKGHALGALMESVYERAISLVDPLTQLPQSSEHHDVIVGMVSAGAKRWADYRHVFNAGFEHWTTDPAVRATWLAFQQAQADVWIAAIEHRLAVPPGNASIRHRASALVWTSTQLLYVATTDVDPYLPDLQSAIDILIALWHDALFAPPPATA